MDEPQQPDPQPQQFSAPAIDLSSSSMTREEAKQYQRTESGGCSFGCAIFLVALIALLSWYGFNIFQAISNAPANAPTKGLLTPVLIVLGFVVVLCLAGLAGTIGSAFSSGVKLPLELERRTLVAPIEKLFYDPRANPDLLEDDEFTADDDEDWDEDDQREMWLARLAGGVFIVFDLEQLKELEIQVSGSLPASAVAIEWVKGGSLISVQFEGTGGSTRLPSADWPSTFYNLDMGFGLDRFWKDWKSPARL